MRLYAFLLLALCALAARAASIPDDAALQAVKKIDVVPEDKDKIPENVSSEQELSDQANIINDVDNKLRVKPADIPVEVVIQNVEPALKSTEESEEVIRQPIDLRNPGPPQRQEHETQNPEFYAAEQQIVQTYKQNINDAQVFLRQGFQGVSDGLQNMFENNEQIKQIQQSIQTLREGFISQINRLNGTIQNYLNTGNNFAEQQTKASIQSVETGLNTLKIEFTRGVKTLADGVDVFASLRAENEKPEENKPTSGGTAPANPAPAPGTTGNILIDYLNRLQNNVQTGFTNLTQSINNFVSQGQNFFTQGQQASTTAPVAGPPAGAQSDSQTPAAPTQPTNPWLNFPNPFNNFLNVNQAQNNQVQGNPQQPGALGSGTGPFAQVIQNIQNGFNQLFQPGLLPGSQTPQGAQQPAPAQPTPTEQKPEPAQPESKPEESVKPQEPEAQAGQVVAVTPDGPIRQILQNNPITQTIAGAVQRLQNVNNPEKPRDAEKEENEKTVSELQVEDKKKGHSPASGDNNDSGIRVEESEPVKEIQIEVLPDVQETKKEEKVEAQKTEEVVDKTE